MTRNRYLVVLSLCLALVPCTFAQDAKHHHDPLDVFEEALKADGFAVHAGETTTLNFVALWCAGTPLPGYGSAMYSNNEQYLQLEVPKSAQEYNPDYDLTSVFQLDPAEAIVLIGRTPPPERYFGFTSFLRHKVMPNGTKPLWISLGDPVNNATVKTTGSTPFNSPWR